MSIRSVSLFLMSFMLLFQNFIFTDCGCGKKKDKENRPNLNGTGRGEARLVEINYVEIVSTLGISNANSYYFILSQSPPSSKSAHCQDSCYPVLSPEGQQWNVITESDGWIDLEYDICVRVNYDEFGNPICDGFLGHVGILLTPQAVSISNVSGGVATLGPYAPGAPFSLFFTPNNENPDFPPVSTYEGVTYRGINLAGGEFESSFNPPFASDALYYVEQGMNTVRLPFKWEYLQPDLSIPVNYSTGNALELVKLINTWTASNIAVIFDMHNYMRYKEQIIGATNSNVTKEDYAEFWRITAQQFGNNPLVFFDLMNEPNSMSTELILENYNAAIAAIRGVGANNLVLLEGNNWSGLNSWSESWGYSPNSEVFTPQKIIDPANNYAINVHQYFTSTSGGGSGLGECVLPSQVLAIENFNSFIALMKSYKQRAILTEIGGQNSTRCIGCIDTFLSAVEDNPNQVIDGKNTGGFIGWTAWTGGHAWDGTNYPMDLNPLNNGDERPQMTEAFELHLTPPPQ